MWKCTDVSHCCACIVRLGLFREVGTICLDLTRMLSYNPCCDSWTPLLSTWLEARMWL